MRDSTEGFGFARPRKRQRGTTIDQSAFFHSSEKFDDAVKGTPEQLHRVVNQIRGDEKKRVRDHHILGYPARIRQSGTPWAPAQSPEAPHTTAVLKRLKFLGRTPTLRDDRWIHVFSKINWGRRSSRKFLRHCELQVPGQEHEEDSNVTTLNICKTGF